MDYQYQYQQMTRVIIILIIILIFALLCCSIQHTQLVINKYKNASPRFCRQIDKLFDPYYFSLNSCLFWRYSVNWKCFPFFLYIHTPVCVHTCAYNFLIVYLLILDNSTSRKRFIKIHSIHFGCQTNCLYSFFPSRFTTCACVYNSKILRIDYHFTQLHSVRLANSFLNIQFPQTSTFYAFQVEYQAFVCIRQIGCLKKSVISFSSNWAQAQ